MSFLTCMSSILGDSSRHWIVAGLVALDVYRDERKQPKNKTPFLTGSHCQPLKHWHGIDIECTTLYKSTSMLTIWAAGFAFLPENTHARWRLVASTHFHIVFKDGDVPSSEFGSWTLDNGGHRVTSTVTTMATVLKMLRAVWNGALFSQGVQVVPSQWAKTLTERNSLIVRVGFGQLITVGVICWKSSHHFKAASSWRLWAKAKFNILCVEPHNV